jgi:hypothetical protein
VTVETDMSLQNIEAECLAKVKSIEAKCLAKVKSIEAKCYGQREKYRG